MYAIYLFVCQVAEGAKAAGASRIIGIDIDSKKFDRGTALSNLSKIVNYELLGIVKYMIRFQLYFTSDLSELATPKS